MQPEQPNIPLTFLEISPTEKGRLIAVTPSQEQDAATTLKRCLEAIAVHTTTQDHTVHSEITAGSAAEFVFSHKFQRNMGLKKKQFCEEIIGRDERTVRDWRASAGVYLDIGGIGAPVQPTAVHQLIVLKKIQSARRKEGWEAVVATNGGTTPTGAQLTSWAQSNDAFIPKFARTKPTITAKPIEDMADAQRRFRTVTSLSSVPAERQELMRLLAFFEDQVFPPARKAPKNAA